MEAAQGARRLQPRRGRPAAPRDGQEDQVGDGRAARRASSPAARAQRHRPAQGERAVRLDRQVRRLRLQQEPRRRLRAGRLPDRLAEGASSGRILRRLDVLRHAPDRQARHLRRRHAAAGGRSACRPRSMPARPSSRSSRTARRPRRPLRARRAQGRRREGDGAAGRRARGQRAASQRSTISPRGSIRGCSTAARSRASPAAARSTSSRRTGPPSSPPPRRSWPPPRAPPTRATSGQGGLFGEGAVERRADPDAGRRRAGRWPSAWRRRRKRSASISPPIRSTATATSPRRMARKSFAALGALPAPADGGRIGAVMAGLVEEARWRTSARGPALPDGDLSDSSGQFVATVFDDDVAARGRGGGQVGRLRPAQCRARPPARRGDAAGDDPLAAVVREPVEADPASARGRGRRSGGDRGACRRCSPSDRGGSGELRLQGEDRAAARRSWCSAATSASMPSWPRGSSGSTASSPSACRSLPQPRLALVS